MVLIGLKKSNQLDYDKRLKLFRKCNVTVLYKVKTKLNGKKKTKELGSSEVYKLVSGEFLFTGSREKIKKIEEIQSDQTEK